MSLALQQPLLSASAGAGAASVADDMLDYTVDNVVVVGKIKNEII